MFSIKRLAFLAFSVLTSLSNLARINHLNWKPRLRVFPKQDTTAAVRAREPRPDGQPGRMPNTAVRWQLLLPY